MMSTAQLTNPRINQFSKRAILIEPNASTVAILFDDGTQEIGHLVVGCDGSRSKIREFLVGKDKAKSQNVGLTIINHSVTGLTAEQTCTLRKYHPIVKLGYDPSIRGVFLIAGINYFHMYSTVHTLFLLAKFVRIQLWMCRISTSRRTGNSKSTIPGGRLPR
jgi:2-polyprenyl-6-methoxyphenol hydroxylase-like FAD-dependent oxidoreductase